MNTAGILPIELTPLHWLLAYATAFIYVLSKVRQATNGVGYNPIAYLKKYWASTLSTIIAIPVLLIVCAENLPDVLPINNITACLVGWNTNSIFKTLMGMGAKKHNLNNETEKEDDTKSPDA